jgi:hypothetical protein
MESAPLNNRELDVAQEGLDNSLGKSGDLEQIFMARQMW